MRAEGTAVPFSSTTATCSSTLSLAVHRLLGRGRSSHCRPNRQHEGQQHPYREHRQGSGPRDESRDVLPIWDSSPHGAILSHKEALW